MEPVQQIRIYNLSDEDFSKKLLELKSGILGEIKQNFTPPVPEKYLTKGEVCQLLKITKPTLDRYTNKGLLKRYSLGGSILFKKSEVEKSLVQLD